MLLLSPLHPALHPWAPRTSHVAVSSFLGCGLLLYPWCSLRFLSVPLRERLALSHRCFPPSFRSGLSSTVATSSTQLIKHKWKSSGAEPHFSCSRTTCGWWLRHWRAWPWDIALLWILPNMLLLAVTSSGSPFHWLLWTTRDAPAVFPANWSVDLGQRQDTRQPTRLPEWSLLDM